MYTHLVSLNDDASASGLCLTILLNMRVVRAGPHFCGTAHAAKQVRTHPEHVFCARTREQRGEVGMLSGAHSVVCALLSSSDTRTCACSRQLLRYHLTHGCCDGVGSRHRGLVAELTSCAGSPKRGQQRRARVLQAGQTGRVQLSGVSRAWTRGRARQGERRQDRGHIAQGLSHALVANRCRCASRLLAWRSRSIPPWLARNKRSCGGAILHS